MTSTPQQPFLGQPPPRLARYRSTRKAFAQRAVANAPLGAQPPLPGHQSCAFAPDSRLVTQHSAPVVADVSVISQSEATPDQSNKSDTLSQSSIQRSRSRYRKTTKFKPSAAVPSLPIAAIKAQPHHVSRDLLTTAASVLEEQGAQEQPSADIVIEEYPNLQPRDDGSAQLPADEKQEQSAPPSMPASEKNASQILAANSAPVEAEPLHQQQKLAYQSAYGGQASLIEELDPKTRSATHALDLQDTLQLNFGQNRRYVICKTQRRASFPPPSARGQHLGPHLVKRASLDSISHANKEKREELPSRLKEAIIHQDLPALQSTTVTLEATATHPNCTQNEVKMVEEADTDHQRRMQETTRLENQNTSAEERHQAQTRSEEEELQLAGIHQREGMDGTIEAKVEPTADQKKELTECEWKEVLSVKHQRKENDEGRTRRHSNQSFSALKDDGPKKDVSQEVVRGQEQTPSKYEPLAFLKKRRPKPQASCSANVGSSKRHMPKDETTIRSGGGGAVPGVDAPISAINAGDRSVLVDCNMSSIRLPITNTTTAEDLIRLAATRLNESIDPDTFVLLESFGKICVERTLRNYEHVRDVMNSWDDDRQNSLVVVPSATRSAYMDPASSLIFEQPDEVSFRLHYSQQPSKWKERWITLRSDGQIVSAKSAKHKRVSNVCHMSDFDIYTPSQQQLMKKLKAPNEFCFAVKSQQKSTMFMNPENFVHFFSVGDKETAATWYKAVQGWRSWYLVNVLGRGTKPQPRKDNQCNLLISPEILETEQKPGSSDTHYQNSSSIPLLDSDMSALNSGNRNQLGNLDAMFRSLGKASTSSSRPPISFPKPLIHVGNAARMRNDDNSLIQKSTEDDTFAPTGLLGRSYSTRQKPHSGRQQGSCPQSPFNDGFTENSHPSSTDPSLRTNGGLARSPSNAWRTKPLVDLTSTYQEASRYGRNGRGFVPEHIGPGGLVGSATSPELAMQMPMSNDWRAQSNNWGNSASTLSRANSSALGRNRSVRSVRPVDRRGFDEDTSPFAPGGLLSSVPEGLGEGTTGRGFIDGSKIGIGKGMGPMLDMNIQSKFADGSLLRKVEAEETPQQPVFARAKGKEIVVGTGEGI